MRLVSTRRRACAAAALQCAVAAMVMAGLASCGSVKAKPDASSPETDAGTDGGLVVECTSASDCPVDKPVCDVNVCRGCVLDSECPSGACGEDGACVDENAIVYVEPGGSDAGTCTRATPCRTIGYGISQTSPSRVHVVLAQGGYIENGTIITAQTTTADHVVVHGGGSSVTANQVESGVLEISLAATLKDLEFVGTGNGTSLTLSVAAFKLERVSFQGGNIGIDLSSALVAHDVQINNCSTAVFLSGSSQLTLDRGKITNVVRAINAPFSGANVQISNLLVYGASGALPMDLSKATGTLASSTVAASGTDSGTGPRAIACSSQVTVRSSIVWTPGTVARAPVEGCNLVSSIIGPTAVPGATNADPQFVDLAAYDFHLAANSPARDAVDSGPATDFEGDARPMGARFDIGADEAAP